MDSKEFLERFFPLALALRPARKKQWTLSMTQRLQEICIGAGYHPRGKLVDQMEGSRRKKRWVECNGDWVMAGEFRTLDMVFFSREPEHCTIELDKSGRTKRRHWRPMVVIEHENEPTYQAARSDFWKACLHAVPLRILIGYGIEEKMGETPDDIAAQLIAFYRQVRLRQLSEGETLLIIGGRASGRVRGWHVWLLRGEGEWKSLACPDSGTSAGGAVF
jgi:hypothetical protein